MVTIKADSPCKKISFFSDGYQLKGTLHLPTDACPPVVIGSHGLLSSSESPKQHELAKRCNEIGIAFFRFDHRGCGKSQGYFPEVTSLNTRARDLICAVNTIRARKDTGDRFGLFGSSMGGAACLSVARQIDIDALVTFAAPIRSETIDRSHTQNNDPKRNIADIGHTPAQFDIADNLQGVENILIFHGDADDIVPYASALEIFELAGEPKRLIRQKQGDHPMSRKVHQKEFIRETVQWFKSALF
jgi:alpha-beta hydrolase superfamily lysophospholipase